MVFGNINVNSILGGVLGGLTGGTAVNTFSYGPTVPLNTWTAQYNPAAQATTYYQTAQWLGQIQGTAFTNQVFDQAVGIISPTIWMPHYTPEELALIEANNEKHRIEREAAKVRATELLRSQLSADQLAQFESKGHFDVKIADRVYRITPGRKVHALHEPKERRALCIAPCYSHNLPNEDVALAQKLLLETNEKEFLKTAHRWAA